MKLKHYVYMWTNYNADTDESTHGFGIVTEVSPEAAVACVRGQYEVPHAEVRLIETIAPALCCFVGIEFTNDVACLPFAHLSEENDAVTERLER